MSDELVECEDCCETHGAICPGELALRFECIQEELDSLFSRTQSDDIGWGPQAELACIIDAVQNTVDRVRRLLKPILGDR